MNGNTFGTIFRVTTWGESHGESLGAIVDGCPSELPLTADDFTEDMARRQGGGGPHATPRKEPDRVAIESGVYAGLTTGTPICLRIINENTRPGDYAAHEDVPRPGHGDYTTWMKHGHRDHRGGGRSSARETAARVAAGAIARKILAWKGVRVAGFVRRIGTHKIKELPETFTLDELIDKRDRNALALPLPEASLPVWEKFIQEVRASGDSMGGAVECWVDGLPTGLGEPVFDKLAACLAHGLMSLPAAVGVECGGGIALSRLPGSQIRDALTASGPATNRHGGTMGGMSSGTRLKIIAHFHAPTSIPQPIESVHLASGEPATVEVKGRHDSVPLPRAVPMVEAMVMLALVDLFARAGELPPRITGQ